MSTQDQNQPRTPVWARPAPSVRQPRFTREQIAKAAIAIADAEGFAALSMRRLADELGAGTMTLYHYVPSKQDLLALMNDEILSELAGPGTEPDAGWRDALARFGRGLRAVSAHRPWVITVLGSKDIGPNGMRVLERVLASLAGTPFDAAEKLELIALVSYYVAGYTTQSGAAEQPDEEWIGGVAAFVTARLETGEFPHIQQLLDGGDAEAFVRRLDTQTAGDEQFERGLTRILDGIEAEFGRRWPARGTS
ncbi:TetR/AcrR family transcriptional regulator [Nonomuraea typhae]|uniref:TetR/AcrR family transcriptional regulator n=1 Tax=Nonomuraea typhae TaxID=2603600 RepID=UPI0012FAD29A|nr:TetR/AcrR family transcriptional regulator [Nonomuraea typhae]